MSKWKITRADGRIDFDIRPDNDPFNPDWLAPGEEVEEVAQVVVDTTPPAFWTDESWAGAEGRMARDDRNNDINNALWAVSPGSPLSEACQAAFTAYIVALNRLTVDFATPGEARAAWPAAPALEFTEEA